MHLTALPVIDGDQPLGFVLLLHDFSFAERTRGEDAAVLLVGRSRFWRARRRSSPWSPRALSWRGWTNEIRARAARRRCTSPSSSRSSATCASSSTASAPSASSTDGRPLDARAAEATAAPSPARRARRRPRQPRAVHPRAHADGGIAVRASGERPGHRARAGDARVLGRLGRARQRLRRPRDRRRERPRARAAGRGVVHRCAASGSRRRRSRATTTASPTRACGRSATSRTRGRLSAPRTGSTTETVNQRFADAVCAGGRRRRPDRPRAGLPLRARAAADPRAPAARDDHHLLAHPVAERRALRHLPVARRAPRGLLGASILGFHTQQHCNNFLDSVDRYLEARIDREPDAVVQRGRARWSGRIRSRSSGRSRWPTTRRRRRTCRAQVFARARAWRRTRCSASASIASTTPRASRSACWRSSGCSSASRSIADASRSCSSRRRAARRSSATASSNERVEALAARINERFGTSTYRPIILLRAHHEPPTVFRYYRAADLCYVSSLHDGMNLVAKEFVAARDDEQRRARAQPVHRRGARADRGADREPLRPRRGQRRAGERRSTMPPRSSASACGRCARFVAEFNVYRWAGRMLLDAARLRRRERTAGRFETPLVDVAGV